MEILLKMLVDAHITVTNLLHTLDKLTYAACWYSDYAVPFVKKSNHVCDAEHLV